MITRPNVQWSTKQNSAFVNSTRPDFLTLCNPDYNDICDEENVYAFILYWFISP